jgi:hypothetical protein
MLQIKSRNARSDSREVADSTQQSEEFEELVGDERRSEQVSE